MRGDHAQCWEKAGPPKTGRLARGGERQIKASICWRLPTCRSCWASQVRRRQGSHHPNRAVSSHNTDGDSEACSPAPRSPPPPALSLQTGRRRCWRGRGIAGGAVHTRDPHRHRQVRRRRAPACPGEPTAAASDGRAAFLQDSLLRATLEINMPSSNDCVYILCKK